MDERNYWLGFSVFPGIGPVRFAKLLAQFGSARTAWQANQTDIEAVIGKKLGQLFVEFRKDFFLKDYLTKLQEAHISFLTCTEKGYPYLLAQTIHAPFVLYMKGKFDFTTAKDHQVVAVVGARNLTQYGEQVTAMITQKLVASGCVIVSGLALGVDALAHATTIANGGKTIAVLGCGVDCCTPLGNQRLYDSILATGGLIVSEYPLSMQPSKGSFPSRNRIIAGLSRGVVVTEGAADSGSLITAKYAFANHRPVFAVPGPITSQLSQGPFALINNGAKLVTSAEVILYGLGVWSNKTGDKPQMQKENKVITGDTPEENLIISLLQNESLHFDELMRKTQLNSATLGIVLSFLEMKGIIKSGGDGAFCLVG